MDYLVYINHRMRDLNTNQESTMNNLNAIADQIKETIKPLMVKREASFYAFIKTLSAYCSQGVYQEARELNNGRRVDAYTIYDMKVAHGYNKSLERYLGRRDEDLNAMIAKDTVTALLKINVAVAKKLANVDVKTVDLLHSRIGNDGYAEGAWKINGNLIFSFETIYAGGYNIQCLHIRTIYHLKSIAVVA